MKMRLGQFTRAIAGWPVIKYFVRWYVFETQQLPTLLQTLSDLNHRQLSNDNDRDNLVKSVPVALRKITRDLIDMQEKLDSALNSIDKINEEKHDQPESITGSVQYLLGRVEFVRRELMFEMRYGASSPAGKDIKAKAEILSAEKLENARTTGLWLNLGCGHIQLDGYLNIDRRALPGVDIVAEVDELPLEQGEVDKIFSSHLLEHFPQEQLRRSLLPYFLNLLKKGGKFRAIVPDAEAMIREYSNGNYPYDDLREVIYGSQDYDGDFHFNMFTPDTLSHLLSEAGFKNPTIIERGRKNGLCYEFEILAEKPKSKSKSKGVQ
jgi:hypothetical protein